MIYYSEKGREKEENVLVNKISFDINFDKNVIKLVSNNTEACANSENILDTKLCFDVNL